MAAIDRSDQTVLVTGANSGIGLATAIAAADAGFRVVGTVRSKAKAKVLHTAASEAGVEVESDLLDVSDADACVKVIERQQPWGLVNNAGYSSMGAIEDVSDDEAHAVLETMVVAPMRLSRLALPGMREQGGGRIVNVSSIYGFLSTPFTGWYQGSKHALEGLTDALRLEVASDGIQVVLIQPGLFKTGIMGGAQQEMEARADSRHADAYRRAIDLTERYESMMGPPEPVANTIVGALTARSPRSRYLVGTDAHMLAVADRFSVTGVTDRVQRLLFGL